MANKPEELNKARKYRDVMRLKQPILITTLFAGVAGLAFTEFHVLNDGMLDGFPNGISKETFVSGLLTLGTLSYLVTQVVISNKQTAEFNTLLRGKNTQDKNELTEIRYGQK